MSNALAQDGYYPPSRPRLERPAFLKGAEIRAASMPIFGTYGGPSGLFRPRERPTRSGEAISYQGPQERGFQIPERCGLFLIFKPRLVNDHSQECFCYQAVR